MPLGDDVAVDGQTTWASVYRASPGAPVTSGQP